jgi:hypothetical protein
MIDEASSAAGLAFTTDGDLVHGNFRSITRIDSRTGRTLWRMPRWCLGSGSCEAAIRGSSVYAWDLAAFGGTSKPVVTAWDVTTGVQRYNTPPGICDFGSENVPFGAGDAVFAVCQSDTGAHTLIAFRDTGFSLVENWRSPLPALAFAGFGAAADGSLYSYSPNHEVVRLEPATGRVLNTSLALDNSGGYFLPRMVVGSSGLVFVTSGSTLNALNRDLSLRWSASVPGVTAPAIGGNGILVVAGSGTAMTAYDARTSFYTVPGCRVLDTRQTGSAFPSLAANTVRSFPVAGLCGIPPSAQTVVVNVTVTGSTADGSLTVFRPSTPVPLASNLNYRAGATRAVMALAPLGSLGEISIQCSQASGTSDLVLDVLGYFE